jgi:hypothetical protein
MPSSIRPPSPEISYPLYITNGEQLSKNEHTMTIIMFENGVQVPQNPQKK